jgi:protein transport protein SEC13
MTTSGSRCVHRHFRSEINSSLAPHNFFVLWIAQVYISPATLHTASVNSVAWAPHEHGLVLAAASSDGSVSVVEYTPATGSWDATKVGVAFGGCMLHLELAFQTPRHQVCSCCPGAVCCCLQLPGTHGIGATAVSWAPALQPGALISAKAPAAPVRRLVSSGCDNTIRVSALAVHMYPCTQRICVAGSGPSA